MFDPIRDEWFKCPLDNSNQHILDRTVDDNVVLIEGDEVVFLTYSPKGTFGVYVFNAEGLFFRGWYVRQTQAIRRYHAVAAEFMPELDDA